MTSDNLITYLQKKYKTQILNTKDFTVEINLILSLNCNLNCTNCQALCNINDTNMFTTLEELQKSIPILKDFFQDKINSIVLFGGEPLLNPQLKDICYYIRSEFPTVDISIFTNGILLQDWTPNDYDFIKLLNISFKISLYPLKDYIPKIQQQEEILQSLNIEYSIEGCRPYFVKGSYNLEGNVNPNRFFTCCHSVFPPSFYLYKNKLYRCAVSLRLFELGIPYYEEDYLDIYKLNKTTFLEYCSAPLKICKHCSIDQGFGTDEIIIWNTQNKLPSNYLQSLLDLYLDNYDMYYNYTHNYDHLLPALTNEYFLSKNKENDLPSDPFNILLNRFKKGICDVYIPFNKTFIDQKNINLLKKLIINQKNYLNMNFYFISIDGDRNSKNLMYRTFTPTSCDIQGNFYFLQSEGLQQGYQTFLDNSYINNKIIINNFSVLFDKNYLYNQYMNGDKYETI